MNSNDAVGPGASPGQHSMGNRALLLRAPRPQTRRPRPRPPRGWVCVPHFPNDKLQITNSQFPPPLYTLPMPDSLRDRLSRYRQIKLTVTGRVSKRPISIPVWFVLEDDTLYLLPVQGSDTQWYKNVLKDPKVRIDARGAEAQLKLTPITDAAQVSLVVEKFRDKYGAEDVKRYYSKFDVATHARMP